MINFNEQLTQDQAKYIIEEVFPKAGYRIDHKTLSWWRDAHNYAFNEKVDIPGCSCHYISTYNIWSSRLNQYAKQIEDIAYPPVVEITGTKGKSKGRPKTSAKSSSTPTAPSNLTD